MMYKNERKEIHLSWVNDRAKEMERKAINVKCNSIYWMEDCYFNSLSKRFRKMMDKILDCEFSKEGIVL